MKMLQLLKMFLRFFLTMFAKVFISIFLASNLWNVCKNWNAKKRMINSIHWSYFIVLDSFFFLKKKWIRVWFLIMILSLILFSTINRKNKASLISKNVLMEDSRYVSSSMVFNYISGVDQICIFCSSGASTSSPEDGCNARVEEERRKSNIRPIAQ